MFFRRLLKPFLYRIFKPHFVSLILKIVLLFKICKTKRTDLSDTSGSGNIIQSIYVVLTQTRHTFCAHCIPLPLCTTTLHLYHFARIHHISTTVHSYNRCLPLCMRTLYLYYRARLHYIFKNELIYTISLPMCKPYISIIEHTYTISLPLCMPTL
jgi:hypothetical protein